MTENDDSVKHKGYDWRKMKSALEKGINIFNSTDTNNISIPSKIEAESIYFAEKSSIAWKFLKSLRHSFAHNYISIDKNGNLNILLYTKSSNPVIKLACCLSFENLKKIIRTLKQQKNKQKI